MEPRGAAAEEGWIRPGRGRRRRRRGKKEEEDEDESLAVAGEKQRRQLREAGSALRTSEFWDSSLRTILDSLGNLRPAGPEAASEAEMEETLAAFQDLQVVAPAGRALEPSSPLQNGPKGSGAGALQCVCYGLGNFSSCVKARYQLAFLMLLLQELQIPHRWCHIFDPVFSELEINVLNSLGLTVLLENEEGKRAVCAPTLFYMIHCGKALYNNLLWRNWSLEALPRMVIVGNSFQGIEERVPAKILQQEYPYIAKILEATSEAALPSHPQYLEVFNDTSVHCFLLNKLKGLPREIWESREEPFYQEGDQLEIIQNKR